MPTKKIVDFTSAKVSYFTFKNGHGTGTKFIAFWRQFVYTLLLRRNSEVKKMSSDSERNSFANLSRSSCEDIMEEDEEDVEESPTHKLTSHVDITWRFGRAIQRNSSTLRARKIN